MSKALNEFPNWFTETFKIIAARPLNVLLFGLVGFVVEITLAVTEQVLTALIRYADLGEWEIALKAAMQIIGGLIRPMGLAVTLGCAAAWVRGRDATTTDAFFEGSSLLNTYLTIFLATLLPLLAAVLLAGPFLAGGLTLLFMRDDTMKMGGVALTLLALLIIFPTVLVTSALVYLAPPISVEQKIGPINALKLSIATARGDLLGLTLFIFLYYVAMFILGCAACFTCCVGLAFVYPFQTILSMLVYGSYFGLTPEPQEQLPSVYPAPYPPAPGNW